MSLHFQHPIQTQSVLGLPLQTLVYEVCCVWRPSLWDLMQLDLSLLCKYRISDILSGLAIVRPLELS